MNEETRKFIEEQHEKLARMIVTTMATKDNVAKLDVQLGYVDSKVDRIEKNMATKEDLRAINNKLGRMETQKLERIQSLELRKSNHGAAWVPRRPYVGYS